MMIASVSPLLTEELFQHIWKFRLFKTTGLSTTEGEPVQVIHPGTHNHHAGPDFTAAKIRIGNTLWAGNVELHLRTSDWYRHGHQRNKQYSNVILHVVFEHDVEYYDTESMPPCIELQQQIPKLIMKRYDMLRQHTAFVPCEYNACSVPELIWHNWKERLLIERWERKTSTLQNWLLQTKYNWEEVCYRAIAQSFGMPVNAMPFLQLAQSLPHTLLARHRPNLLQLEALLFGQAGMLQEEVFQDAYPRQLQQEYGYLRHKYRLQPLPAHLWNWLRMRPASFPTMRIATLAALIYQTPHLFSGILETESITGLEQLFAVQPSAYWQEHYRFDSAATHTRCPGRSAVHNILINTILPLLFLYGKEKGMSYYQERALQLMEILPAEENKITNGWDQIGIMQQSALDSQALLQLKQHYCDEKKCLECAVGAKLLREGIF
ncbi:DUF2851 family protein [Chitinophaga japonensis]|uniref:Uncharacterized protein DUF2851 n=1 Tax=Chitinophaga japonensis TaxID=104662 RepID=A0A562T4J1_CHIJA|nr:DUF2851 family protein [Chitinophaga japonensis]TWI88461.1 uncharacterized protein DUF2851 [Chitinophaga japonensis]